MMKMLRNKVVVITGAKGTLVNMYGNGSFLRPASPTGLYGATKAWVTSFTLSLAREISGSGVKLRVNS